MLRTCNHCGLEAHTEEDLSLFVSHKQSRHKKSNVCLACKQKISEQWNKENREYISERMKQRWQNNPDKVNANTAKRRATKLQATPIWYTMEKKRVEFLYATARANGLHVDHIIPLRHDMVCGLHTLSNLQLLTPTENYSKSNKFEG